MKRIVVIILAIAFLAGCSQATDRNSVNSEIPATMESIAGDTETSAQNTEKTDNNSSQEEGSESTKVIINKQESEIQKPVKENNSLVTSSETVHRPETENKTNSNNNKGNSSTNESVVETTNDEEYLQKISDEKWIANEVLKLLNEERKALGINTREMLNGLNNVAVLRSEQLVTQFSHKWVDDKGVEWSGAQYASTVLKYGNKEQSSIYDLDTETVTPIDEYYYDYGGTENCYYGGTTVKPKSEIAESIVNTFKDSAIHWSSLMSSSMKYDGIGITFSNNAVYCSVNSSAVNYG